VPDLDFASLHRGYSCRCPCMPAADLYPYVYVNADGAGRELHPSEQKYLETEFKGGDGAAPLCEASIGWAKAQRAVPTS